MTRLFPIFLLMTSVLFAESLRIDFTQRIFRDESTNKNVKKLTVFSIETQTNLVKYELILEDYIGNNEFIGRINISGGQTVMMEPVAHHSYMSSRGGMPAPVTYNKIYQTVFPQRNDDVILVKCNFENPEKTRIPLCIHLASLPDCKRMNRMCGDAFLIFLEEFKFNEQYQRKLPVLELKQLD